MTDAADVDPAATLRSRGYLALLLLAAVLGGPISAVAYVFLELVAEVQVWVFTDLPHAVGYAAAPSWWPLPVVAVAGLLVGATIRYLPGRGGHVPAEGLKTGGFFPAAQLPGVALAALAGLGLGVVLGPEAPLIALGGGLAALAVRPRKPGPQAVAIVAAAGSFAAISALFGSPLLGAFLLMEALGLGGAMLGLVLVPGLLAAGIGALVFIGLGSWTGKGTFSLTIPDLPEVGHPTVAGFGWSFVIGVAAAVIGTAIRQGSLRLSAVTQPRIVLIGPFAGLVVGGLATLYAVASGHSTSDVLFSGQDQLPGLITHADTYAVASLVGILAAKGLAFVVSLACFRGGPVFPSLFLGAALGITVSHLPGLPTVSGAAIGIGAMAVTMLRLPLTSVLLATLLFGHDGIELMPLVIVAVVVAHVVSAWLTRPGPSSTSVSSGPGAGGSTAVTGRS